MKLNLLGEWLSWIEESEQCESDFAPYVDDISIDSQQQEQQELKSREFHPAKKLCERDNIIIDMLNSASSGGSTTVSFCVTDPSPIDNPVVYVSDGFSKLTGYEFDEVVGRNCRFLQGPETARSDVEKIIHAIKNEKECSVNLLNYKKDGTKFRNEFYLAQLRSPTQELAYFIGIQAAVDDDGDDIIPSNPGVCNTFGEMKYCEL
mmetsp:Transcript_25311/g.45604  ORF Transcript_25311/g.45604 Transcript_25311/m.45604 type:complete len:205 (-) Transcript_25311:322-936(-)